MKRHPRLLTSLCAGAVGAGLLVMPVSYQHTVGHSVKITIAGQRGDQDPAQVARLARQVRSALHAQGLQVEAEPGTLTLTALLSTRSRAEVQRRADALVKGLAHEHLSAQAQVAPRTELVAGRVYAMALDKVIEIRVDLAGKSAAQIEDEIREQLERQGVADAEVKVQREGGETSVRIGGEIGDRNLLIENRQVGGPQQIEVRIGDLDTRREPGMTDDQLREKIERQLRARGLEPQVTVQGDKVRIEARKRVEMP